MRVLVAGATGQVGQGLLEACAEAGADAPSVVALVRRRQRASLTASEQVVGDVGVPQWGVSDGELAALGEIDAVLNLAGVTDWTAGHATLDGINVLGAVHGMAVAERLGQLRGAPVPYLSASSVFVAGLQDGNVPEEPLPAETDRTPYELSKWYAERAVSARAARSGHPVLVARIGGAVGNSRTGRTTRRSSLYQLVSARDDKRLPVLPTRPGARVDTLPRNILGATLLRLLGHGRRQGFAAWHGGMTVQVAAGEQAPTLAAMLTQLDALDEGSRYRVPVPLPVPAGVLTAVTRVGTRYVRWSRQAGNRLQGLRYVAVDRIFERSRLAALTGGWLPAAELDTILRVTFDLPIRAPVTASTELPMGRFV
jgi:nucleoside-diphosphate-sugar epimerase